MKMFLEEILGSKTKIKLLRTLFERNTAYTRQELEEETGLSTGAIHSALMDLKKNNIVQELRAKGKKRFYKINMENKNQFLKILSDLFDQERFSEREESIPAHHWNRLADLVKNLRNELGDELSQIVLFGSIARGEATPGSDLDLLIVLEKNGKKNIRKEIRSELEKRWNTNFSLIVHSEKKIKKMKKKRTGLYEEIQRDGTVIYRKNNSPKVIE